MTWWDFLSDYKESQLSWRINLFAILATCRYETIVNMIKNARRNRAQDKKNNEGDLVYISTKLYQKIEGVMTQKLKYTNNTILL